MRSKAAETVSGSSPSASGPPRSRRAAPGGRDALEVPGVETLQILDERGEVDRRLEPELPDEELLRIHRAMVLTRKLDIRMLNMQRQGKMGTFAPGYGQEATQIGQVHPLASRDWYAPSYRSFGAQIWRGWTMERLLLLWDGYFEGFPPPAGVNDLPFSIVVGSHVLPAVGVAMAIRYRDEDAVIVTNFGDGALSQGAVSEALNLAAVSRAPAIFVCENNGWAISTPTEQQSAVPVLAQRGVGFGLPSIRVDGNDVLAMIVAARGAVDRARAGEGPTFIEALTYRMGVHTTADDPRVYRREEEVKAWEPRCPIARFEKYLTAKGLLDDAGAERVAAACEQEVLEARDRFEALATRNPREVFEFVFEQMPPELRRQQEEYFRKLDRKRID